MRSNMGAGSRSAAFTLLLLVSVTQGFPDFYVTRHRSVEALVGQSVSLPCIVTNFSDELKVINNEWSKIGVGKLALYMPGMGFNNFTNAVVQDHLQVVLDDARRFVGTNLTLPAVRAQDAGVYFCDIATFPAGSVRTEIEVKVKELNFSSNTTDDITAMQPDSRRTTDAPTWSTTTDFTPDTITPAGDVTNFTLIPDDVPTTAELGVRSNESATIEPQTLDPGNASTAADVTETATETVTDTTYREVFGSTVGPIGDSVVSTVNQTGSPTTKAFVTRRRSAPETSQHPSVTTSMSSEFTTEGTEVTANSDWKLVFVIVPILVFISVVALICRRLLLKRDQPPSFKPPPPPVKYVAVKQESIQWQTFPVSKCNSVESHV